MYERHTCAPAATLILGPCAFPCSPSRLKCSRRAQDLKGRLSSGFCGVSETHVRCFNTKMIERIAVWYVTLRKLRGSSPPGGSGAGCCRGAGRRLGRRGRGRGAAAATARCTLWPPPPPARWCGSPLATAAPQGPPGCCSERCPSPQLPVAMIAQEHRVSCNRQRPIGQRELRRHCSLKISSYDADPGLLALFATKSLAIGTQWVRSCLPSTPKGRVNMPTTAAKCHDRTSWNGRRGKDRSHSCGGGVPACRPHSRRGRCPAGARPRCGRAPAPPPPPAPGSPPTAPPAGIAPYPAPRKAWSHRHL